jgi:hypothetical protein
LFTRRLDSIAPVLSPAEATLAEFLTYWNSLRGRRALPDRSQFSPADIPRLLPYITVVEPLGERFRIRLVGTEIQWRIGRPVRVGMFLDELETGDYLAFVSEVYRTTIADRCPVFARTRYSAAQGEVFVSRLAVPFLGTAGAVAQIMSVMAFSHSGPEQAKILGMRECAPEHSIRPLTNCAF